MIVKFIEVEITDGLTLPRFSVEAGFKWDLRPDRVTAEGFILGSGFVKTHQYKVRGFRYGKTTRE